MRCRIKQNESVCVLVNVIYQIWLSGLTAKSLNSIEISRVNIPLSIEAASSHTVVCERDFVFVS